MIICGSSTVEASVHIARKGLKKSIIFCRLKLNLDDTQVKEVSIPKLQGNAPINSLCTGPPTRYPKHPTASQAAVHNQSAKTAPGSGVYIRFKLSVVIPEFKNEGWNGNMKMRQIK